MDHIGNLRLALLISLCLLLLAILYRRFKIVSMARHMPVKQHAELVSLTVGYHPTRLRAEITVPSDQQIMPSVLDMAHRPLHQWQAIHLPKGMHTVELDLLPAWTGEHYFELSTGTQRTVRKFRILGA